MVAGRKTGQNVQTGPNKQAQTNCDENPRSLLHHVRRRKRNAAGLANDYDQTSWSSLCEPCHVSKQFVFCRSSGTRPNNPHRVTESSETHCGNERPSKNTRKTEGLDSAFLDPKCETPREEQASSLPQFLFFLPELSADPQSRLATCRCVGFRYSLYPIYTATAPARRWRLDCRIPGIAGLRRATAKTVPAKNGDSGKIVRVRGSLLKGKGPLGQNTPKVSHEVRSGGSTSPSAAPIW